MPAFLSKTLAEWKEEANNYYCFYYDRYVTSMNDLKIPKYLINYYANVATEYRSLFNLLQHIQYYGRPVSDRCKECRIDSTHTSTLEASNHKYSKWIKLLNTPKSN